METVKIKSITINHFRGITNEIKFDFSKNKDFTSFLIFGENGSGKSSIIDAIEIASIAKFDRTRKKAISQAVSYEKTSNNAFITLELSNNNSNTAKLTRSFGQDNKEKYSLSSKPLQEFIYAPFVLRRNDILSFWSLKETEKLKVFWDLANIRKKTEKIKTENEKKIANLNNTLQKILIKLLKLYPELQSEQIKNFTDFATSYFHTYGKKYFSETHPNNEFTKVARIRKIEKDIQKQKQQNRKETENFIPEGKYEPLRQRIDRISNKVTQSFLELSTSRNDVDKIIIETGVLGELSLSIKVLLKNGSYTNPEYYFSEANRDLLALLIYLEFTFDSTIFGQAKVLVLDDVFQSVDSTIRFDVMVYILKHFSDWQLIIATHDRLWKEQIQLLFNNHGKSLSIAQIKRWNFTTGPIIIDSRNMYDEKLKDIIETGSPVEICAGAGYLLEIICEQISFSLKISLHRCYGDKYTIGDLWPGIYKACKKVTSHESFDKLNDLIGLRNLVGCHYNQWAVSLSSTEAEEFANAVLDVYKLLFDSSTGKWITDVSQIDILCTQINNQNNNDKTEENKTTA